MQAAEIDVDAPNFDFDASEEPSGGALLTKVVVCFRTKPLDERWRSVTFKGFDNLIAGTVQVPLEQFVGVDVDGQVVSFGSGHKEQESRIPRGRAGPQRGGIRRTKTIAGILHACSGYRGLARRDGSGQWTSLCENLPLKQQGFEDFDAFPSGEFYAAGGRSDVWRRSPA